MDFTKLAESRYSVRKLQDKPVSKEDLEKILHAGHVAPTGCNNQPQRVYVIQSEEALAKLAECTRCHFNSKTVLLVCYKKDESWIRPFDKETSGWVDATIVADHMVLQAWDIGVGSCYVMYFQPEVLKKNFELPEDEVPVVLLPMGYPAEDSKPSDMHTKFKDPESIIKYL